VNRSLGVPFVKTGPGPAPESAFFQMGWTGSYLPNELHQRVNKERLMG